MNFKLKVRKWHKWMALIVGLQIFFWTASGLFMSFVPIETIRSEHLSQSPPVMRLTENSTSFPISSIISKFSSQKIIEIKLKHLLELPIYEVTFENKKIEIVDAINGNLLSPLSRDSAEKIALAHFTGSAKIKTVVLQKEPLVEYRGKLPVWKIDFQNLESTAFYISPSNGKLTARRSTLWRIFDFLWMLHIMDYDERSNFNHWWLVLFSFLAVAVSATGLILLKYSFRWRLRK